MVYVHRHGSVFSGLEQKVKGHCVSVFTSPDIVDKLYKFVCYVPENASRNKEHQVQMAVCGCVR